MNDNVWLTFLGRIAQVIGIPIVIGASIWGIGLVSDLKTTVTTMSSKLDTLSSDQYHGADAKRDLALRDLMIKFNTDRYDSLVSRVQTLETGSARRAPH